MAKTSIVPAEKISQQDLRAQSYMTETDEEREQEKKVISGLIATLTEALRMAKYLNVKREARSNQAQVKARATQKRMRAAREARARNTK